MGARAEERLLQPGSARLCVFFQYQLFRLVRPPQYNREQTALGCRQAVRYYIISAMLDMEDSDVFARCKFPLVTASDVDCVVWGAYSDYRWIKTASQLRNRVFLIVE